MKSTTQAEIRNLSATEGRITSAITDPIFISDLSCEIYGEPCWTRTSDPLLKRPSGKACILLIDNALRACGSFMRHMIFPDKI